MKIYSFEFTVLNTITLFCLRNIFLIKQYFLDVHNLTNRKNTDKFTQIGVMSLKSTKVL